MLEKSGVGTPLYLGCFAGEEIIGFLPGFLKEAAYGPVYSSLPFFGPNASVLCDYDSSGADEVHEALFLFLTDYLKERHTVTASFYTPFRQHAFDQLKKYLGETVVVEKFTNYLDLNTAEWSTKIAYDIRKAQKAGVEISTEVTEERIVRLFEIYQKNCEDYGIPPKPFEAVKFLCEESKQNPRTATYFAFFNGEMIGALIMIYGPSTASYYLPCSLTEHRSLQPNTLLIDYAVQDARARDVRFWNWESSPSKDSGVFQFKKKWGSEEDYYYIHVKPFVSEETLAGLRPQTIAAQYPFFFVYPFNRLVPATEER
jgi:hypothetical protein